MLALQPIYILGMRFRSKNRAIAAGMLVLFLILMMGAFAYRKLSTGPSVPPTLVAVDGDVVSDDFPPTARPTLAPATVPPEAVDVPTAVARMPNPLGDFGPPPEPTPTPTPPATALPTVPPPVTQPPVVPALPPVGGSADVLSAVKEVVALSQKGDVASLSVLAANTVEASATRALAIYALGRIGTPDVFERLKIIVESTMDRFCIRETALYVMVEVFPDRTGPFLLEKVRDGQIASGEGLEAKKMHDLVLLGFYADREATRPLARMFDSVKAAMEAEEAKGNHLARQVLSFGMVRARIPDARAASLRGSSDLVIRSNYVSSLRVKALETGGKEGVEELKKIVDGADPDEVKLLARIALSQVGVSHEPSGGLAPVGAP